MPYVRIRRTEQTSPKFPLRIWLAKPTLCRGTNILAVHECRIWRSGPRHSQALRLPHANGISDTDTDSHANPDTYANSNPKSHRLLPVHPLKHHPHRLRLTL
jgi:hypothetical protein